jgi:multidrug efflux system membrane fusion protein
LGEQVITEGGDRLKEGAKVTLPGAAGPGAHGRRGAGAEGAPAPAGEHRRRNREAGKEGAAQQ